MSHAAASTRRFRVYARHVGRHHALHVEEESFEAAAVAYLEGFDHSATTGDDQVLRVIVHDVATAQEHCFSLDRDTGDATPSG